MPTKSTNQSERWRQLPSTYQLQGTATKDAAITNAGDATAAAVAVKTKEGDEAANSARVTKQETG